MSMTRRDFLNGTALTIAAGMLPAPLVHAAGATSIKAAGKAGAPGYPPALTGLRGNHAGSYTLAHSVAREGVTYPAVMPREVYDLVVVGGGISGLAAAWFYRRKFGADKRILILENHDDFGGHARRNEFTVGGKRLVTYGGSADIPASALDNAAVAALFGGLGVDARLKVAEDMPFAARGMGRSMFFNAEHFGRDQLVAGDPFGDLALARVRGAAAGAGSVASFLARAPLPVAERAALERLAGNSVDFLGGMPQAERAAYIRRTSYAAFLRDRVGLGVAGLRFFRSRTNDAYALDSEGVSVLDALAIGLPCGAGMPSGVVNPLLGKSATSWLRFPDGNAGIARLLVRDLIPGAAQAGAPDAISSAAFDYAKLDQDKAKVRLRLNSLAIRVEQDKRLSRVTYGVDGSLFAAETTHIVMAGYNMMIPFIMPDLPQAQKDALRADVKAPLVYTKVALDNWRAFDTLKTHTIHAPTMRYTDLKLEKPAGAGPDDPVVLHMLYVPTVPDSGMPARDRFRAGRAQLLATPYAALERDVLGQLDRILGPAGFKSKDVVRGVTVNRWSHGYACMPNSLFEDVDQARARLQQSAAAAGRVAIAGSDAGGSPSLVAAIDHAARAVEAFR